MPILEAQELRIDYTDEGSGAPVVLVHSSVSGNRQWRALAEALKDRYRVLAPNLLGYGETPPWQGAAPQSLHDQARLVVALCAKVGGRVHLVGHSFGGAVAIKAASLMGADVASLVLLEPIPFYLLLQDGRHQALAQLRAVRDDVLGFAARGEWPRAAQRFADYWMGEGAWDAMPEKRRVAFAQSLPPNIHEWDAVIGEETTIEACKALPARTLLVSDPATRLPVREIVAIFARDCPHWRFHALPGGGHMAPLTRPELVNPVILEFLETCRAEAHA